MYYVFCVACLVSLNGSILSHTPSQSLYVYTIISYIILFLFVLVLINAHFLLTVFAPPTSGLLFYSIITID